MSAPPPSPDVHAALRRARVYLIVTEAACRRPWERAVERAVSSGVIGIVQFREKTNDDAEFVRRAHRLRTLAHHAGTLLVLNDRAHLVVEADADGLHTGEHDLVPDAARVAFGAGLLGADDTADAARRFHEAVLPEVPPGPEFKDGVPTFFGRTAGISYRPRLGAYAVVLDAADRVAVMRRP